MKKLIIINGEPGTGKTSVSKELNKALNNSVWLDGDWCWMMQPFVVNEENKRMVEGNIRHMLTSFLENTGFEYVIFNWVIPHEDLMNRMLSWLKEYAFELHKFSLIADDHILADRMRKDGRSEDQIKRAVAGRPVYEQMDTVTVNTSNMTVHEIVQFIVRSTTK